jgi:hypothetical protein
MKSVSIDLPHWNGLHQTRSEPRAFTEHTTKAFEQGFNSPKYGEKILPDDFSEIIWQFGFS